MGRRPPPALRLPQRFLYVNVSPMSTIDSSRPLGSFPDAWGRRKWIVKQPLKSTVKFVLLALEFHADIQTGHCFPSVAAVREYTGLTRKTIHKALATLEKGGYIIVEKRAGYVSHYTLTIPENQGSIDARVESDTGVENDPTTGVENDPTTGVENDPTTGVVFTSRNTPLNTPLNTPHTHPARMRQEVKIPEDGESPNPHPRCACGATLEPPAKRCVDCAKQLVRSES